MSQSECSLGDCHARRGPKHAAIAIACSFAAGVMVCGCAVDDRTLITNTAAAGSSGATGVAGGPSSLPDSGAEQELPPLPRCVYLGTTVEPGCETLVKNAGFGSNVASWVAEPVGMSEGWLNSDASEDPDSGSMFVMNLNYKEEEEAIGGSNGGAARQCVTVTPGTAYGLAADVFIPAGQGMGFEGEYTSTAALSVFYYEGANCAGPSLSNFTSTPVTETDEWIHVEGWTTAPKESQSMAVRLATLKPFRQIMFGAHFDNVLVRERGAP